MTLQSHYWAYTLRIYHNSKGHMYSGVHCSTVYNSQDIEATAMSNKASMNKEDLKLLRLILFQPRLAQ